MAKRVKQGNGRAPEIATGSEKFEEAFPELSRSKNWDIYFEDGTIVQVPAHDAVVGNGVLYVFDYRTDLDASQGSAVDVSEQHRRLIVFPGTWKFAAEEGTYRIITPDLAESEEPDENVLRES